MLIKADYSSESRLGDFKLTVWNLPQWILLILIRAYQRIISPALAVNTCRFYPSCSHYGYQAIYKYGAVKGLFMALKRILRRVHYRRVSNLRGKSFSNVSK